MMKSLNDSTAMGVLVGFLPSPFWSLACWQTSRFSDINPVIMLMSSYPLRLLPLTIRRTSVPKPHCITPLYGEHAVISVVNPSEAKKLFLHDETAT